MTKRNNTQSANLTLGGITLGFLVSYPFYLQGSFVGGLISSGCSAGMIGGLADWFAVTALFRRPLGIRPGKVVRTEIIPQNRERIFTALADMVQQELFSQDILRRKLSAWDFSGVLIRVFQEREVQETVNLMLANTVQDIWNHREPEVLRGQIKGLLKENIKDLKLSQTLAEVLEFSIEHGDIDGVLTVVCRAITEFVDQTVVQDTLKNMMEAALTRYEENNSTRKMIGKLLPSPAELAHGLQEKVRKALQDGTVVQWLKESLLQFVLELKTKTSLQERLDIFVIKVLDGELEALDAKKVIAGSLGTSNEKSYSVTEHLLVNLRDNWQGYLKKIEHNKDFRAKVNEEVKSILEKQIIYHHNAIGRIVREGLDPLTDEKLVELIEDKAGNDLQMIRINGSVVGGLAGMLIYLLGMVLQS
ncbi:DUF445 domain-containing protein [Desulfosporosinus shakirovi]|uniref:DUF445 domain-containing protein n=1 Tax=Desulfosporosinus shakirovi TaxID=2885154 RepID=UPI001E5C78E2|nr:DUF445 domain-containing protein [Desulfosporosinus sp. SRJS8]MCB8817192.1 DUF445 domain-containing protein [Desulfosporosinus sp. SRJS8]